MVVLIHKQTLISISSVISHYFAIWRLQSTPYEDEEESVIIILNYKACIFINKQNNDTSNSWKVQLTMYYLIYV